MNGGRLPVSLSIWLVDTLSDDSGHQRAHPQCPAALLSDSQRSSSVSAASTSQRGRDGQLDGEAECLGDPLGRGCDPGGAYECALSSVIIHREFNPPVVDPRQPC